MSQRSHLLLRHSKNAFKFTENNSNKTFTHESKYPTNSLVFLAPVMATVATGGLFLQWRPESEAKWAYEQRKFISSPGKVSTSHYFLGIYTVFLINTSEVLATPLSSASHPQTARACRLPLPDSSGLLFFFGNLSVSTSLVSGAFFTLVCWIHRPCPSTFTTLNNVSNT